MACTWKRLWLDPRSLISGWRPVHRFYPPLPISEQSPMTITDSPISLVRSLKGAPLACLFILLLSGEALRAGALCQATGYSPNSITAALRPLSDLRQYGPPSRSPDVNLLLAAIAEAYVRRHTLRKPARVAYANLKR